MGSATAESAFAWPCAGLTRGLLGPTVSVFIFVHVLGEWSAAGGHFEIVFFLVAYAKHSVAPRLALFHIGLS